ncbi:MAG: winged helix-turn-helix transcriptional regulator [Lachnospiraceae bacterium]|nr:winged helix-turn-helix transcriptional regulator [Lachnospiraceae bacterium]
MKIQSSKPLKRYNYLVSEIDAVYHEISQKLGISDSVSIVLYTICDLGDPCPLKSICRSSGISKQTINSALRKLEAEGILYLEPDGHKAKTVCLTEKGRALADRTAGKIIEMENDIFSSWAEEDVNLYLELTERYLRDLKGRGSLPGKALPPMRSSQ